VHCANETPRGQILSYPEEFPERADIILLGTIHRFEALERLLKEFLLEVRPSIVTVEISPFSVSYRRKKEPLWLERLRKLKGRIPEKISKTLEAAFRMPLEFRLPQRLKSFPVVPVDLNGPARKYLAGLEALLENPPEEDPFPPHKEALFLKFFLEGLYHPPKVPEDFRRERHMAHKIRRLSSLKRPLVHIGGWRHLPGLLSLLPEAVGVCLNPFSSPNRARPN
jgi:hypothetical protein